MSRRTMLLLLLLFLWSTSIVESSYDYYDEDENGEKCFADPQLFENTVRQEMINKAPKFVPHVPLIIRNPRNASSPRFPQDFVVTAADCVSELTLELGMTGIICGCCDAAQFTCVGCVGKVKCRNRECLDTVVEILADNKVCEVRPTSSEKDYELFKETVFYVLAVFCIVVVCLYDVYYCYWHIRSRRVRRVVEIRVY